MVSVTFPCACVQMRKNLIDEKLILSIFCDSNPNYMGSMVWDDLTGPFGPPLVHSKTSLSPTHM